MMHILYQSLASTNDLDARDNESKLHLLQKLEQFRELDFVVDDKLILEQLDENKRSMINGYDEGAISTSWFVFFSYNPLQFKETLIKNGKSEERQRIDTFLCNYMRENEIPKQARVALKGRIIEKLKQGGLQDVAKSLSTDCDTSINLYD